MNSTSNEIKTEQIEADICVVGGGPIGLTVALAAAKKLSLRVVVLETGAPSTFDITTASPMDSRVYAISPASRALLESLGVWQAMHNARLQAVQGMRVWGENKKVEATTSARAPDLEFAAPTQSASIATIVEYDNLLQSLTQAVHAHADIRLIYTARPSTINTLENAVFIGFTDNDSVPKTIKAKLLIGADGVNSWVRAHAGFAPSGADYSASAIVANFACEKSHGHLARQWFLGGSVLALLPLAAKNMAADTSTYQHQVSMVWSCEHAQAQRIMENVDGVDLAKQVSAQQSSIADELGALTLLKAARKFPLSRRGAAQWVAPCVALMGDAAHSVHPLAGQGANLGFGDVTALIESLRHCGKFSSIGDVAVLQRYPRSRREHSLAVTVLTDGLYKLNLASAAPAQWLRHEGLQLVNRSQMLKRSMMAAAAS